jgi:hypothetical protein
MSQTRPTLSLSLTASGRPPLTIPLSSTDLYCSLPQGALNNYVFVEAADQAASAAEPAAPLDNAAKSARVKSAPVEVTPVEAAPLKDAPAEANPVEAAPLEFTPLEAAPVEAAPLEDHFEQPYPQTPFDNLEDTN